MASVATQNKKAKTSVARFRAFWERLLVPADNAGLKD